MKKLEIYYYVITGYATYDNGHEYLQAYDNTDIDSDFGVGEDFKEWAYKMFEHSKDQFKYEIDRFLRNDSFRRRYRNVNNIDNQLTLEIKKFAIDSELVEKYVNGNDEESKEARSQIVDLINDLIFENIEDERIELISEEIETFEYIKEESEDEEEDEE